MEEREKEAKSIVNNATNKANKIKNQTRDHMKQSHKIDHNLWFEYFS